MCCPELLLLAVEPAGERMGNAMRTDRDRKRGAQISVEEANQYLAGVDAVERIRWAYKQAPKGIIGTTSGGRTSRILPSLISKALGTSIPMIFVDTGHYPPTTYKFVEEMRNDGIDVRVYGADMSPGMMEALYGPLWNREGEPFERFLTVVKHEPLEKAFQELKPTIWLRGVMGFQTAERATKQVLEYSNGLYQLHPAIDWTEKQAERYLKENNLPLNLNHYDITKGAQFKNECGIDNVGFTDGAGI